MRFLTNFDKPHPHYTKASETGRHILQKLYILSARHFCHHKKKKQNIKLYDFVEPELNYFREQCNFSPEELCYFNLRAKYYSNQQIAIKMNISEGKVSKLARAVKSKILRVI